MNKHKVPSPGAQSIIIKLSRNKNVKLIEFWHSLIVQFGTNIASRSQVCKYAGGFKIIGK